MNDKKSSTWRDPNSMFAYFALGFISMAGIYYVNILPVLVGTLIDGLGFSESQAGYISSANVYGASLGAVLAVLVIKSCPWKKLVTLGLGALVVMDFASVWLSSFELLVASRFISGVFGGMAAGCVIGVMARLSNPTRAYGVMLMCHFSLGGLGMYLLPMLVPYFGAKGMFLSLMTLGAMALIITQFCAAYPIPASPLAKATEAGSTSSRYVLVVLALISLFLCQGANMEFFVYLQRLGLFIGLEMDWVNLSLAIGLWVGIAGAVLAAALSTRFGRAWLIAAAALVSAASIIGFLYIASAQWYLILNITLQIAWAFLLSYLFGICADLDVSGRLAASGGVMSKLGLSTGPFVAASIVNGESYDLIVKIGFIGIILCFLCAILPAIYLDKRKPIVA
ncbi:MFS transporter [Dasania sp. GY-MA-18]|uniref:MFS transporter n=1 Tax=Dasania phycosphaerae TaxID=2950436 RepID=A0A9J6RQU4_9GAMM|nr:MULTISPECIES: MFS transporter [Dasania]MCR8924092.1 MFS transporter [Dasania sp. GY-MA-18]MCZ0866665.1 MFS transporter [Dasania phycosphaerae]MCZ0870250.1 MFS transporter [Dasania phycosphaerae]